MILSSLQTTISRVQNVVRRGGTRKGEAFSRALTTYHLPLTTAHKARGFTLIELVVTVGILVVITGVVLANHGSFGDKILLRNLAYDVALTIREAQVYGISARSSLGGSANLGHGVYFNMADARAFFSFTDISENLMYSDSSELVETYTLSRAYRFVDLCATVAGSAEVCGVEEVHILFKRPEPDAILHARRSGTINQQSSVRLILQSPQGDKLAVLIESTGQISVARVTITP